MMDVLLSTNMYDKGMLKRVLKYLLEFKGRIGVEVFPLFQDAGYEDELINCMKVLETIPSSFHGPYYRAEHSAFKGSEEYVRTMDYVRKTLEYCKKLNSKYMVFHHNNCKVKKEHREEMIRNSCENFREMEKLFGEAQIPVYVENAGVMDRGNMLFNQEEFIALCKNEKYRVLIDIGHAHANGWNLSDTMEALKDQIKAYHIHNNDGIHDDHNRIMDGTLDFDKFISDYRRFTPEADFVVEYSREVADDEDGIKEDVDYILKAFH